MSLRGAQERSGERGRSAAAPEPPPGGPRETRDRSLEERTASALTLHRANQRPPVPNILTETTGICQAGEIQGARSAEPSRQLLNTACPLTLLSSSGYRLLPTTCTKSLPLNKATQKG